MSSESLDIKVRARPDFKDVDKDFERIAKKGKKDFRF